ncbi:MAG: Oxygen-independent coproporphyrinogen-III oxidase 1 [Lentisphaerae bacterium ADurb.BinA184]|nr:MAG: Oxygen-independent coproporphyrinogen-III oxidase 1 [Lentisphaerae bacterium ADurb.BinA184]
MNLSPDIPAAAAPPFESLYVHVPFCRRKCGYCAFYSVPAAAALRRRYLDRLTAEFAESAERCSRLRSVFLGGGTPSVLTAREMAELLAAVRSVFTLVRDAEVTAECNPESLTPAKAEALAAGGVSRVSLGVQSFQARHRRTLQRGGAVAAVAQAVARLRGCGVRNLGLDLIYGIPGQTVAEWGEDVGRACDLGVQHLSTYALTVEEGTRLAAAGVRPADDDRLLAMWERAETVAAAGGLRRYEVSNFARPGRECRHNMDVWHGRTYLGCGPAACSFDGRARWTQPSDLNRWLRRAPPAVDVLPADERAAEVLAFGLRTVAGWEPAAFRRRTGYDAWSLRGDALADLARDGLLTARRGGRLAPTARGLLFHDWILRRLL